MMRHLPYAMLAMALPAAAPAREPAAATSVRYGIACDRPPGSDVGAADLRIDPVYFRIWKMACGDATLRALNQELARLGTRIAAETAGIDGETGQPIDHYGDEQRAWQRRTLGACRDRACMADAYRSRIADVKVRWREALD